MVFSFLFEKSGLVACPVFAEIHFFRQCKYPEPNLEDQIIQANHGPMYQKYFKLQCKKLECFPVAKHFDWQLINKGVYYKVLLM